MTDPVSDPSLLGATEALQALASGRLTSESLCAACLDRIEAQNPMLNAIVAARPREDILSDARASDAARARGAALGRLAGLPMAPKDLLVTAGITTTWGSTIFRDHVPEQDDLTAARLRQAGAIFIGKTNTPEFGLGSHSFNEVYGVTRNPWDTGRSAGGSSGGAGVALATRMLPLADGSDMMGSLRNPAGWNNVYGFRPTWGLVPGDGPGDHFIATMATDGPMARTVRDVALLLDTMTGPNPYVPFPLPAENYSAGLDALRNTAPRPLRIGWLGDWGGAYVTEPGILDLCRAALGRMQDELGATIIDLAPPMPAEKLWQSWGNLRAFLNAGARKPLAQNPDHWKQLKPEMHWEIEQGRDLTLDALYTASIIRSQWYARAASLFADEVDLLALPSAQVWPFPVEQRWPAEIAGRRMDTYHRWMEVVLPASLAGLPALSVPVGFGGAGGRLPMGMQLIGPSGGDMRVLGFGERWNRVEPWSEKLPPQPA